MKNKTKLVFLGTPIPKGRPRFFRKGKHIGTFTPDRTRNYENMVMDAAREQFNSEPMDGPLSVTVTLYMPIPKSRERKLREGDPHVIRPDLDNCVKAVTDALNELVYEDDSQIHCLNARKVYGKEPRTEVEIEEVEEG